MELRCMKRRFPDAANFSPVYNSDGENESPSFDKYQLVESDLISWRELQKILYLTFKNGSVE